MDVSPVIFIINVFVWYCLYEYVKPNWDKIVE